MTQTTPERKPCGTCGNEYTVTAAGTIRHHTTNNPDFQADPTPHTSNKCKGAGQPPAGAAPAESADGPQCRLCKHPVQLTDNGRVRSHLTPEATPRPCPAGSDFPLGAYPDMVGTTDGLVATLRFDCGHVPAGECYGCYGEAGNPISDTELDAMADAQGTGTAPWGVDSATVTQPTMADQLKATPLTALLEQETARVGTVLDVMDGDMRAEAERFMAAVKGPSVPAQPTTQNDGLMDVYGRTKDGGVYCQECDTDNHRCPGCGDSVPHGTVACTPCDRRVLANRLPKGETEDGRPCHHDDAQFGVENDRLVCVACGTPCTHPNGFTENDPVEDDGEGLIFRCGLCGSVDSGDTETHVVGDDSDDPEHVDDCPGCTDKEQRTGPVRLGDLDEGDLFTRNGTLMRLTERESSTSVLAEVLDGPHRGRTGELKNLNEMVERASWFSDPHAREADAAIATVEAERAEADRQYNEVVSQALADQRAKTDDGWRTPADVLALMSEEIRGMDALRRDCADCGHPITPLIDQFSFDGRAAVVRWVCEPATHAGKLSCTPEEHECRPDCLVSVGDLEFGDFFVRRGVLMRCTSSGYGVVEAVVADGPMKGRTGELRNAAEQVERTYCHHNWVTEVPPGGVGFAGPGCEYCGEIKTNEKETKECPSDQTPSEPPRSSAEATTTTGPSPVPGSKLPSPASAQAVLPQSNPVTSSALTAKASTKDRSAAVTTDQRAAAFLGGGQPSAPAANGPVNQAGAAAFLAGNSGAHGEKETDRDHWGRYLILHPDTGKEKAWTRATTFAKSISDTYALSQWGLRMALLGATVRPDIVQRAHGKHVKADKQLLDELTADLKNAAGDKVAANLGTSMHSFTELADRAWHSPDGPRSVMDQVPPDCQPMVETYIRLLEETGLEPVADLIEFTTLVKQYDVAGTSDNCYKVTKPLKLKIGRAEVQLNPGEYVIGDKKTGKDLDYGWQEIVIQLAVYAQGLNTVGRWDRREKKWYPKPLGDAKVRLDAGVVIHLPVDAEAEKQPAVYGVDLESGWNAAVLCERVRAWRKVRYLASPVMVSEAETTFTPARSTPGMTSRPKPAVVTQTNVRPPSLKDRAGTVTSKTEASAVWQDAKKDGLSDAEVDELVALMQSRLKKLAEPGG